MAHSSKEGVNLTNMLSELAFEKELNSVLPFGDNTGTFHVAGNSIYQTCRSYSVLPGGFDYARANHPSPHSNKKSSR